MAGVRPSIEQPAYYARVNVEGTTHLLQAAVQAQGGEVPLRLAAPACTATSAKVPFSEEDPVAEPISPYAATKRAGELICYTFWHLYKLPVACLRFFTVYGPRQRPDLAIHKFTRLISQGEPVPFFGDGSTSRDYTFVDDIVAGIVAALRAVRPLPHLQPRRLRPGDADAADRGARTRDRQAGDHRPAARAARRRRADVRRPHPRTAELGYEPKVSLAEGLRRFVEWFREYGHLYQLPAEGTSVA